MATKRGALMAYRLKHKPTGLFYTPSRQVTVKWRGETPDHWVQVYVKSNLSKTGKLYHRPPPFSGHRAIYDHTAFTDGRIPYSQTARKYWFIVHTQPDDWEIVQA